MGFPIGIVVRDRHCRRGRDRGKFRDRGRHYDRHGRRSGDRCGASSVEQAAELTRPVPIDTHASGEAPHNAQPTQPARCPSSPARDVPERCSYWVSRPMVSRTAARVGSRIDGVDDASGSASDRAAREAVRLTFVDQTLDRMRVRAAYRIMRRATIRRVGAMARTTSPGAHRWLCWRSTRTVRRWTRIEPRPESRSGDLTRRPSGPREAPRSRRS